MNNFRAALLEKLDETGIPLKKVAEGSGVSYEQLKKLKQIPTRTTNVEDGMAVARFFGLTLEDFIDGEKASDRADLIRVLDQLSPSAIQVLTATAKAQLDAEAQEAD
ncbi:hypothetical protein [Shimia sp.]|uniref:hypothetical protein n=1 Tax=Shimia sp. TaxID=1954381 RepID=UPI003B8E1081